MKSNNENTEYDVVQRPEHYCSEKHECIKVMEYMLGTRATMDFCKGNIFKYRFRADKKNGQEDKNKAVWYEDKLIELQQKIEHGEEIIV